MQSAEGNGKLNNNKFGGSAKMLLQSRNAKRREMDR